MLPRGMNPRQMNQMMRKLGINVKDIENVEKVIILTDTLEYVFTDAEVTVMNAQGQKTYQIAGNPQVKERKKEIPKEDIQLIIDQTGSSEEEAKEALEKSNGDIAEAILLLTEQ
jgi:nascent polypeptide-associated complex subunit alpha